jgi:hypothetical protein
MRFLAVAVAISVLAVARIWPSQTNANDNPECSKTSPYKMQLTADDTTILGLTVGISMKDVQAKMGQATPFLPRSNSICFASPTDGTVLTFSTGPMGGFENITGFELWSHEAKFPNVAKCTRSTLVSQDLSTNSGIRLGLSAEQLAKLVGASSSSQTGLSQYEMWCRQKMTDDDISAFKKVNNWDVSSNPYFDVGSFVQAHFIGARVSRIKIAQTKSY